MATALVLIALALTTVTSCRSGKQAYEPKQPSVATGNAEKTFDSIIAGYDSWHSLKIPFSARIDGMKMNIGGTAYIVRDSVIYLSAKFLGMEVAAVKLTSDSLIIVDKYHRKYLSESTTAITKAFPLTIGNLQDLLIGHCFIPGANSIDASETIRRHLHHSSDDDGRLMASVRGLRGPLKAIDCKFFASGSGWLESLEVDAAGHSLEAVYGEPGPIEGSGAGTFASSVNITVPDGDKHYGGSVRWNLRKASTGRPPQMRIPPDCERVDFKRLAASLKSM